MDDLDGDAALDAGRFGAWFDATVLAIRDGGEADVPCGACDACCRSAQFVHIAPDEHDALAHVPAELLVPAPGAPAGHVVMGFDGEGRCPMLGDHGCTIYAHRPRTCRTYDCRVFAAAGVDPADDGKERIAERARRWRFDVVTPGEAQRLDDVRAAAVHLRARGGAPSATALAVAAVMAAAPSGT